MKKAKKSRKRVKRKTFKRKQKKNKAKKKGELSMKGRLEDARQRMNDSPKSVRLLQTKSHYNAGNGWGTFLHTQFNNFSSNNSDIFCSSFCSRTKPNTVNIWANLRLIAFLSVLFTALHWNALNVHWISETSQQQQKAKPFLKITLMPRPLSSQQKKIT